VQEDKRGMLLYSEYIVYHTDFLTFFACIHARDPNAEGRGACFLYGVLLLYVLKIEHESNIMCIVQIRNIHTSSKKCLRIT